MTAIYGDEGQLKEARYKDSRDLPRVLCEELTKLVGEPVTGHTVFDYGGQFHIVVGKYGSPRMEYRPVPGADYYKTVEVEEEHPRHVDVSEGVMRDIADLIERNAPPDPWKLLGTPDLMRMVLWSFDKRAQRFERGPYEEEEIVREEAIRAIVRELAERVAATTGLP